MKDTDLTEVFEGMKAAFKKAFGDILTVEVYDIAGIGDELAGAAVLLESVEFEIDNERPGHGDMLWLKVQFHAHCIMTRAQENGVVEVQNLAALVIKLINKNRWGLTNIGHPNDIAAMPGKFTHGPGGFESWAVTWSQTVAIGETWENKQIIPEKIMISEAPNIGADYVNDYEELKDEFIPAS